MFQTVFEVIPVSSLIGLSWRLVAWAVGGIVAGVLVGLIAFLLIRAAGGYRLEIRGGGWLRAGICVLAIAGCGAAGGYAGFLEGGYRGLRVFLDTDRTVAELNAGFGKLEAMFFAGVYRACLLAQRQPPVGPEDAVQEIRGAVASFADGREEIDAGELQRNMNGLGQEVVAQVIAAVELAAAERWPSLETGLRQGILRNAMQALGGAVVRKYGGDGIKRVGLDVYLDHVLTSLQAEAGRGGNPKTISFQEMSTCLAREGLMPWILRAAKGMVRSHQVFVGLLAGAALGLPVLGVWIARRRRGRRRSGELSGTEGTPAPS